MHKLVSIKLNKDFRRAYYQGKFKAYPLLVTYQVKNRDKQTRIGITTSKKIGCAVLRNRARRIIKQAFFELMKEGNISAGYDYVFVARQKTAACEFHELKKTMKKQIFTLSNLQHK